MLHQSYRADNPRAPLAVFLTVGLFIAAIAYGTMKLNQQEDT